MPSPRTFRRWLAGLGAATALVAAVPAAATAATDLQLYANDVIIAPTGTIYTITVYPLTDVPLSAGSTLTIDRSEVDGFAVVQLPFPNRSCTESGAVIRCVVTSAREDNPTHLSVSARPGATAGQQAALRLTLDTPDRGTTTARPTITVGEGVNLVAGPGLPIAGPPNALVKAPLSVTNQGEKATRGLVLLVYGPYPLVPGRRYDNCEYGSRPGLIPDETVFACTFPDVLEPGTTARLDDSFALRIRPDAWAPNLLRGNAEWVTPAEWDEFLSYNRIDRLGPNGDDGVLTLDLGTTARANELPQTDLEPFDNLSGLFIRVTGNHRSDLAAEGATARGRVGDTVEVTVGWRNNGPATVAFDGSAPFVTVAMVTVPPGTTAVAVPDTCRDAYAGEDQGWGHPGSELYECTSAQRLTRGDHARIPMRLRVERAGSLTGQVRLRHRFREPDSPDLNPANDTAAIRINPATGGGGGGEDDGGSLPITGAPTGLIAGVGALLLVAGAAGYVLTRRRRTRFVA
ncbi:LPXTG cell wall anchor domain-containing protein [Micromonospora sp. NPDC005806]|uniref:LPXTG cell wall anchor domain-containing protein n=1 Tax=Micromonospora sp. NPDC005806 TaxID=3364234 RepID=UPI0036A53E47